MLLVDANVLVYAIDERARQHEAARNWLRAALNDREAVGFAWTVVLAFLRLTTHPAVFARPLTAAQAGDVLERWLGSPPAVMVEPTRGHLPVLRGLLERAGIAGNLVADAHLAALAIERGATVVSFDRDFARFDGVALVRPAYCSS